MAKVAKIFAYGNSVVAKDARTGEREKARELREAAKIAREGIKEARRRLVRDYPGMAKKNGR
jgi:hypothetical protein